MSDYTVFLSELIQILIWLCQCVRTVCVRVRCNKIKDMDFSRYQIMPASLDYFVIETDLLCWWSAISSQLFQWYQPPHLEPPPRTSSLFKYPYQYHQLHCILYFYFQETFLLLKLMSSAIRRPIALHPSVPISHQWNAEEVWLPLLSYPAKFWFFYLKKILS